MRTTLAGLALVGTLALAGCGGAGEPPSDDDVTAGAAATEAATDAAETAAPADAIDVVDVELRDCIVYPEERELELEQATAATDAPMTLDTVPCEQPHDTEVYAIFDLPEEDYPGDEAVMSAADEGCYADFEAFVGNAYEDSQLDIEYFFPSKESWSWDGDRQVTCMVYHLEGEPLTGSAAGSGL